MSAEPIGGTPVERLVDAMRQVRDRCVWTQGTDHAELVPYLIEESYELDEAVEAGTREDLVEELGDVLWQVVFHAEIASRYADEPFGFDDVALAATAKMVRRHPHVFGDDVARTPEEVVRVWNRAKAAEKSSRTSVLDGIPQAMPSLALADKVLGRAAGLGIGAQADAGAPGTHDQSDQSDQPDSAEQSAQAAHGDHTGSADPADETELGRTLLALVARAREHGLDAERALRGAVRELQDRVRSAEAGDPLDS